MKVNRKAQIKRAASVTGSRQETFKELLERRTLPSIMDHQDHPLQQALDGQRRVFSKRMRLLHCLREPFRRDFLLRASALTDSLPPRTHDILHFFQTRWKNIAFIVYKILLYPYLCTMGWFSNCM